MANKTVPTWISWIVSTSAEHYAASGTPATPPPGLPEKFWDAERGELRADSLAKSYQALEQKPGFTVARFNRGVCLGMLSSTHERDKDPKKYEDYRTELMREIIALRRSSPKDADELFRRFYNKSFR